MCLAFVSINTFILCDFLISPQFCSDCGNTFFKKDNYHLPRFQFLSLKHSKPQKDFLNYIQS